MGRSLELGLSRLVFDRGSWPPVYHVYAALFRDVRAIYHIAAVAFDVGPLRIRHDIAPVRRARAGDILYLAATGLGLV